MFKEYSEIYIGEGNYDATIIDTDFRITLYSKSGLPEQIVYEFYLSKNLNASKNLIQYFIFINAGNRPLGDVISDYDYMFHIYPVLKEEFQKYILFI